jgi:hypothetical protein
VERQYRNNWTKICSKLYTNYFFISFIIFFSNQIFFIRKTKFDRNYGAGELKARLPLILKCVENIKDHIVKSHLGHTTFNAGVTSLCDKVSIKYFTLNKNFNFLIFIL